MWEVPLTMSDHATRRSGRRIVAPVVLAALLVVALPAAGASAAGASGTGQVSKTIYRGSAWGTSLKQHQGIRSGHSAPATLSCLTVPGQTYRNTVASVHTPQNVFHTGVVLNKAQSLPVVDGKETAQSTSIIHDVSMLQGLIHAQTIKAVTATSRKNGAYSFSTEGSQFGQLTINGQTMNQPAQHQVIELPGLGKVTLFDNGHFAHDGNATSYVNMMLVEILHPNDQGVPVGTKIVIGHARAGLGRSAGPLGGRAWGSRVAVGHTLESGPSFTMYLPCPGTNGKLLKQSGAATNLPAPIDLGTVTNTAKGTVGQLVSTGETTSQIADVDLGDGQITADLIKADAKIQRSGGQVTIDTTGSHFGSLFIGGQGQAASPDPNTVIQVPGLGKVTLYEVTKGPNFVIVRMFHLEVLKDNPDIPIGTDVVLGYAKVSVH
jgi:hypothetical protein